MAGKQTGALRGIWYVFPLDFSKSCLQSLPGMFAFCAMAPKPETPHPTVKYFALHFPVLGFGKIVMTIGYSLWLFASVKTPNQSSR